MAASINESITKRPFGMRSPTRRVGGGRQRPETYISLLSDYYLNQSNGIAWDRIKDQDDVAALRDFVSKYPSSPQASFARNRLEVLERFAKEREDLARRAREDEQPKAAEADAQRVAREA